MRGPEHDGRRDSEQFADEPSLLTHLLPARFILPGNSNDFQYLFVKTTVYSECMLDRRIELLRILDQVGTITEAAHLLYRSPSGYSRQLRGLADELGVELLEQHGREVRLTPAALRLVAYANNTQAAWERTKSSLSAGAAAAGPVRLGAHPTALSALIAPNLGRLAEEHPDLDLRLFESEAPRWVVLGTQDEPLISTFGDLN